jgi:hypothetical protein
MKEVVMAIASIAAMTMQNLCIASIGGWMGGERTNNLEWLIPNLFLMTTL